MGQSYRFNTLALHAGVTIDETNSRGFSPIALGYVARESLQPGTALTIEHGDRRLPAVVGVLPFVACTW